MADRSSPALLTQVTRDHREVGVLPDRPFGRPDRGEVDGRLGHRAAGRLGKLGDEPEVLVGQRRARTRPASRPARGRRRACSRRTAPRPRSRPGRRRRAARSMPFRSARTSASATASLSPKITVLTASFMAAPVPRPPRWKTRLARQSRTGRARSRSAASPPTMIVELAGQGATRRCPRPARRGCRRRARGRPARPTGSCRAGRCSCRRRPNRAGVRPRRRPDRRTGRARRRRRRPSR